MSKIYFFEQYGAIPDDRTREHIIQKVDDFLRSPKGIRAYEFHVGDNDASTMKQIIAEDNGRNIYVLMDIDNRYFDIFAGITPFTNFFLDVYEEYRKNGRELTSWQIGQLCKKIMEE